MQPLPSGEDGWANGRQKSTAGTGPPARASGDRLFLSKCARAKPLALASGIVTRMGQDSGRPAGGWLGGQRP